jgi:hypothetical protein
MQFDNLVTLILERLRITDPALKIVSTGEVITGVPGKQDHAGLYELLAKKIKGDESISFEQALVIASKMLKNDEVISGFVDNEGKFYDRKEAYRLANPFGLAKRALAKDDGELNTEDIPE